MSEEGLAERIERFKAEAAQMSREDLEYFALGSLMKQREISAYSSIEEMRRSANDIFLHWRLLVDGD